MRFGFLVGSWAGFRLVVGLMSLLRIVFLAGLVWVATVNLDASSAGFVTPHGLVFEPFAEEPQVVDPVAMCFDEEGRAYVVEMRDYPLGIGAKHEAGGTVRLLVDLDGDGRVDRSTVFADRLSFATSITPWKGGVLVSAPPEIVYLKDTDGDGKADLREVWFSGFNLEVTDSNMSGLRWGLDNRIHGVNGGNGGDVVTVGGAGGVLRLGNADFSFDPRQREIGRTFQTSGGFGLAFDDWGHSFSTYNINHVQQRVVPLSYGSRCVGTPARDLTVSISDHEDMARIFPVSLAETRVNHPEQAGFFSSAGGIHFLSLRGWPGDLSGSLTVGDMVGNLIHRDVLRVDGAVFKASRGALEEAREFIAATNRACRPIALEAGPDGALYLLDMQRDVIEHPDYIPAKVKAKLDVRAGEDRGRIYRVHPRDGWRADSMRLDRGSPAGLVDALGDANAWRRTTAQRLLVEMGDARSLPLLHKRGAKGQSSLARLHALWTLEGLGELTVAEIVSALGATEAGLRENAIKLAERHLKSSPALVDALLPLREDGSGFVRLQLALTLGDLNSPVAEEALLAMAKKDAGDGWIRWATLSGLQGSAVMRLRNLCADRGWLEGNAGGQAMTLELTATVVGARGNLTGNEAGELERILQETPVAFLSPILKGLEAGQMQGGKSIVLPRAAEVLGRVLSTDHEEVLMAAWPLQRRWNLPESPRQKAAMASAQILATRDQASEVDRLKAIGVLSLGDFETVKPILWKLLEEPNTAVQLAIMGAIRRRSQPEIGLGLVSRWPTLQPVVRPLVLQLLLSRLAFHEPLVSALESGQLQMGELNLDLEQRRTLLRQSSAGIKARAAKFMGDEEYSNRKQTVDDWLTKIPANGSPAEGRALFEKVCASCHVAGGIGRQVGPDLQSVSHRSVEDLLYNILDPNMAINPAFVTYRADLHSGDSELGLLQNQSSTSVTLLQALEIKITVPRSQIKRLQSTGKSLMPEGLEAGMSPQDLRNLIAFLQGHP